MSETFTWERWESLRTSEDPDPIEVLRAVASFQRYFKAIERQAIEAARAQGRTWQEIGSALGKSRQAVWQRAGVHFSDAEKQELARSADQARDARLKAGLDPF